MCPFPYFPCPQVFPLPGKDASQESFFFFFLNFWLCWVFAAVCSRLSLVAVSEGCSVVAVGERLISVASLVAEHGLEAAVVAAPGL